jgi:hypothetical protein
MIYIDYIFNRNWVDTRWQQYSTHLHTNSTQNTQNGTYITIKNLTYITFKKIDLNIRNIKIFPGREMPKFEQQRQDTKKGNSRTKSSFF